jgi:hypothetical protein
VAKADKGELGQSSPDCLLDAFADHEWDRVLTILVRTIAYTIVPKGQRRGHTQD